MVSDVDLVGRGREVSREGEAINIGEEEGNMHRDYNPQTCLLRHKLSVPNNFGHVVGKTRQSNFLFGFFLGDKFVSNVSFLRTVFFISEVYSFPAWIIILLALFYFVSEPQILFVPLLLSKKPTVSILR